MKHTYSVQLYGALQVPNSKYTGAGFVIAGGSDFLPAVSIKNVKCM